MEGMRISGLHFSVINFLEQMQMGGIIFWRCHSRHTVQAWFPVRLYIRGCQIRSLCEEINVVGIGDALGRSG